MKNGKHPGGRPPKDNKKEIQAALCRCISTSSKSLRTIIKELSKEIDDFPNQDTVFAWLSTDKEFSEQYARAKQDQCYFMAEEILEIADDGSLDMAFTEEGKAFIDKEHINRSRLRVDTRKWILSKLKPKKYGDKLDVEHSVSEINIASLAAVAKDLFSGAK